MAQSVTPLAEREIAFKQGDKEYKCSYREMDTLLYQWKKGILPPESGKFKTTGEYVSSVLGWDFPLPDSYLMHFVGQCNQMQEEYAKEMWGKFNQLTASGGLQEMPVPGGAAEILGGKSIADMPPMAPKSEPRPKPSTSRDEVRDRADLIIDIASMVIFLMRVGPDVDDWGLRMMEKAGYSRRDIEDASNAISQLRRQR